MSYDLPGGKNIFLERSETIRKKFCAIFGIYTALYFQKSAKSIDKIEHIIF